MTSSLYDVVLPLHGRHLEYLEGQLQTFASWSPSPTAVCLGVSGVGSAQRGYIHKVIRNFPELQVQVITSRRHLPAGTNRNRAIAIGKARYVVLVDADDEYSTTYPTDLIWFSEQYQADIVLHGYTRNAEEWNEIKSRAIPKATPVSLGPEILAYTVKPHDGILLRKGPVRVDESGQQTVAHGSGLFKRSLFVQLTYSKAIAAQDTELIREALSKGIPTVSIHYPAFYWREGQSIANLPRRRLRRMLVKVAVMIRGYLGSKGSRIHAQMRG